MSDTQQGNGSTGTLVQFAGTWTLVPAATSIEFHTKAMWLLNVKGTFTALEGTAAVTEDGAISGSLAMDAASVNTGTARRDVHLRTKDFFDVEKNPRLVYTVTAARPAEAGKFTLSGMFTVHGQTHPLDVIASVSSTGPDSMTVTGEGDLDRGKWGLTWAKMGAGMQNHLVVTALFARA